MHRSLIFASRSRCAFLLFEATSTNISPSQMFFKCFLALILFIIQLNLFVSASDERSSELSDTSDKRRTNEIYVQHTMHRIRDPRVSLPFYTEALGLTLLDSATLVMDTESKFTMFFLGYEDPDNIPIDDVERRMWAMSYPGAINLQYIWGENVAHHEYHDERALPTGYSHIGIFATDVYEFCNRLMEFNVTFIKKPDEGVALGNAFILDPDGYWLEIMNPYKMSLAE